jgi:S1-C subfamily serine protease
LKAKSIRSQGYNIIIKISLAESDLGFRYGWTTTVTVEEVAPSGPATQILQPGDKIVKVT